MSATATGDQSARPRRGPRRWVIALIAVAGFVGVGVVLAIVAVIWLAISYFTTSINTIGSVDFDRELEVPPLAQSRVENGILTFDLTIQAGETDLGQSSKTPTWGINGDHLAPTLRAERGEHVRIRVNNNLDETSTLHWHGMHLPAEMDGGPHQTVASGETWIPEWVIDQPAASLWYHPHPHGETAEHVYRGLAGMFILDDADEAALALPREYGVDDVPLIVQDRKFHQDGTLDTGTSFMQSAGILGDTVLVNGIPGAYFDVTTNQVRLRILNGSNTRPYNFAFEDDRVFGLIGTDGGLLPAPVELSSIQLSPGERAEIVVAFTPGEHVRLQSGPSDTGDRLAGGTDHLEIMQFRAAELLTGSTDVPQELVDVPRIEESAAARERSFQLSGFSINDQTMDMSRIDEVITLGDVEVWTITNFDGQTHNFHVHDVQFQILDIDGREPPPQLRGWKDTVWLPPSARIRIAMTFTDYADDESPYMYHCHILRHEDQGLMGQFLVVEPGRSTRASDYNAGSNESGHTSHGE